MQDDAGQGRQRACEAIQAVSASQAERSFGQAWAAALGSRRHAEMALAAPRRPAIARAAAAPRVIGLPLSHSPAPCALGFLQRPPEAPAGQDPGGRPGQGAGRETAMRRHRGRPPVSHREGTVR